MFLIHQIQNKEWLVLKGTLCYGSRKNTIHLYSFLLIYDLQSEDWINTYMLKCFLKAHKQPKVSNKMKCINKKMTWNVQDMNLSWCVHKANMDHTTSAQGTAISTLDYSVTTSMAPEGVEVWPYQRICFYIFLF